MALPYLRGLCCWQQLGPLRIPIKPPPVGEKDPPEALACFSNKTNVCYLDQCSPYVKPSKVSLVSASSQMSIAVRLDTSQVVPPESCAQKIQKLREICRKSCAKNSEKLRAILRIFRCKMLVKTLSKSLNKKNKLKSRSCLNSNVLALR